MKAKKNKTSLDSLSSFFSSPNGKITKIVLGLLLLCLITINMLLLLLSRQDKFFSTDYWKRYPSLKSTYYNSVYANKNGNFPRDEILYAFNGGALLQGTSPILVNPEVPPMGKYLVSLSILLFHNEHLITYIFGILALLMMFLIGMQIFRSIILSLITPSLIIFEPFFRNQFVYTPLFDIFQLVFLLASFYFFNIGFASKKKSFLWFLISSFFLGLFISTKFFATGVPIVCAFIIVLLINKEFKKTFLYLLSLPLAVFILLGSYIRVLIIGYPFLKFLGIQKWIFWYNKGHIHNLFTVWPLLFENRWIQSAGKISYDPQWQITWPISTIISAAVGIALSKSKKISNKSLEPLIVWSFLYLGLLSFSDASARYFVILLPVLFIISTWGVIMVIKKILEIV